MRKHISLYRQRQLEKQEDAFITRWLVILAISFAVIDWCLLLRALENY